MDKIGIICEFNPFHNGHVYFLKKIKKMFPNSFITLVMSTNFTQRGEFSFLTKWEKTKIALENNIDLVLELPFLFTTQSADTFAYYAVSILEYLDMDYLIFGSESNDIDTLKNLASTILYHKDYNQLVKKYLDLGNNYPVSMSKALYNITSIRLKDSNDLLGISYLKTIIKNDYKIKPLTIKREDSYLESASNIREAYLKKESLKSLVPRITLKYLSINLNYLDKYFELLKYKIITDINNLENYLDVSEGLENKIKQSANTHNYQELLENLKSKRYTYNKLNRMFLHILFNIKKEPTNNINYIRVLGFNSIGRSYLKRIKKQINIPIITNYKDIDDEVLYLEKIVTITYLNILNKSNLIKEELMSIPINH